MSRRIRIVACVLPYALFGAAIFGALLVGELPQTPFNPNAVYACSTITVNSNNNNNAGVAVDPKGVLRIFYQADPTGQQTKQRIDAAKVALKADVQAKSKLRKISLQRLEKAVAAQLAAGKQPTDEMKYLAGLTRLQHVFFYPDSGDIVIAGPAEGWFNDLAGRVVGLHSGRAVLELQDLVTALRTYGPRGGGPRLIGCSIDATQEGLAAMQNFLKTLPQTADASMATEEYAQYIVDGLRTSLGLQKVRIDGISPATHFAQVMVEADYRMKLIGLGLETPPVKIVSYVDRADPNSVARNAMQRWWFVPDYQCLRVADDKLAVELVGNSVKLMSEDEVVAADGSRQVAAKQVNMASKTFVQSFTKLYPELAARSYVYAQLRNLVDLSVAAAFIQTNDFYARANWKMETLGDESKLAVETFEKPVHVETAVNRRWKGSRLMTPVGGGVTMRPAQALQTENVLKDDGTVAKTRASITLDKLAEGQWWWD